MADSQWWNAPRRGVTLGCLSVVLVAVPTFACCCGAMGLLLEARAQAGPGSAAATDSVRAFMRTVAHDVTRDGPTAWLKFFDDSPAFFMAVNGAMAFPDPSAARNGTQKFADTNRSVELKWGDDLRVDPLAPGLAVVGATWHEVQVDKSGRRTAEGGYFTAVLERKQGRWRFRDAHWSSPVDATVAQ